MGQCPRRLGGQDHHPPKRRGCRVSAVGNLPLPFSFGATSTNPAFYILTLYFFLSLSLSSRPYHVHLHANHTQFDPCPFSNDVATSTLTNSRLTITTPMSTRTSVYALSVQLHQLLPSLSPQSNVPSADDQLDTNAPDSFDPNQQNVRTMRRHLLLCQMGQLYKSLAKGEMSTSICR